MTGQDPKRSELVASGVDELIARLRDDGVAAGRAEASRLVAAAEARAREVRERAQAEAEELLESARRAAAETERAGREALRVAVRDAVLSLEEALRQRFSAEVGRQIDTALERDALLERMIVEVAGRLRDRVASADEVEFLLPPEHLDQRALRPDSEEVQEGALTRFAKTVAHQVLREGVTLKPGAEGQTGLLLHLDGGAIRIEFDGATLREVIVSHLQPRFRALLAGVLR